MKLIKFFTGFLLIFVVFIFIGEIYVWNLDTFETEYKYVTFYLQENTTKLEMVNDIYNAANKEKVKVFVVDKKVNSLYSENIKIYGTSAEVKDYLANNSEVKEGEFESIFIGNVKVEFCDWAEIPDISKVEYYYVIGSDENIINFKKSLVDKYAGRFPKEGYQAVNSRMYIGVVWSCVIVFLLMLTFYEAAYLKKAIILRITMGEQIVFYILGHIIYDLTVFLIIFIGLLQILNYYTSTFYQINSSVLFFCIFIILNSLIYLWLFMVDYKRDIQTKKSVQSVLKISYIYKIVTSIMLIITMSGCIELIFEGISYYRQKEFFEARKEYSYITVGVRVSSIENAKDMLSIFHEQASRNNKEIGLIDLGKWGTDAEYILADKGAYEYLCESIPNINDMILENKIYYFVPDKYFGKEDVIEDMQDICYTYYQEDSEYEIIRYDETAWVMSISNTGKVNSTLKKNPVVIFNNLESFKIPINSILYLGNATMFLFSDEELDSIAYSNNYEKEFYYKTNVYENYMYYWEIEKRNMLMGIIFLSILLLLEGLILKVILKYEYQINAKEMLLRKVQGDNFFIRHKNIIMILLGGWISLIIAAAVCLVLEFTSVVHICVGGILIMTIEHLFVAMYSHRLENINISKIFKGGIV